MKKTLWTHHSVNVCLHLRHLAAQATQAYRSATHTSCPHIHQSPCRVLMQQWFVKWVLHRAKISLFKIKHKIFMISLKPTTYRHFGTPSDEVRQIAPAWTFHLRRRSRSRVEDWCRSSTSGTCGRPGVDAHRTQLLVETSARARASRDSNKKKNRLKITLYVRV